VRTTRCRSQRTADACRHRETVRAVRTPRYCHHLSGIRNSKSDSYVEIVTDRLRTRLRTLCASCFRRLACSAAGRRFDCHTQTKQLGSPAR
jgi:hypothetical protein